MISYKPFFKTLEKKGITQYQLEDNDLLSKGTLDNLRHNRSITLSTLEYICCLIECEPLDVFEFIKDAQ